MSVSPSSSPFQDSGRVDRESANMGKRHSVIDKINACFAQTKLFFQYMFSGERLPWIYTGTLLGFVALACLTLNTEAAIACIGRIAAAHSIGLFFGITLHSYILYQHPN